MGDRTTARAVPEHKELSASPVQAQDLENERENKNLLQVSPELHQNLSVWQPIPSTGRKASSGTLQGEGADKHQGQGKG